jgi:putative SOS response-associated peptidase YedK
MCYDVKSGTKALLKYAKHRGDDPEYIKRLEQELELWTKTAQTFYHVNGFAHPKLLVFTNDKPTTPRYFSWGLIPHWVKDSAQASILANQTLNARAESIFEKPAFKKAAMHQRCLIYLDAFYEHHHYQKKTFPYHIDMRDETPLAIAGLWDEWINPETGELHQTCSIVTTRANPMMAQIHNNPKQSEARMPAILPKEKQNEWLQESNPERLKELLMPFDEDRLRYRTVQRLKGKEALGNCPEATLEFYYPELNQAAQGSLF